MKRQAADDLVLSDVSIYSHNELGESSIRLEEVNITIVAGEWINVVGVNGSGKSTLARIVAGLHPEGITGEIRRGFAGDRGGPIVLQQPRAQLFGETPREEVLFALEWRGIASELIMQQAEEALRRAGLIEFADEPWERLSGGQQQMAAIAASTACETQLLVLDEVTSMLDEFNRNAVLRMAQDLHSKGTAIVWVTQRLDELAPDSRVVALGEGRIIFDGDVQEFLYGEEDELSPLSPCLRVGLRLPYLAAMALELRRLGKLSNPLPVTAEQWRKVLGNGGSREADNTTR
ncbi:energy-coupling factor ABC transporter ATP-binding protein [Cohnella abietis]|uniref:Energy-coupling factor transporter ATP-binding protein EcfA n=1 Tax=Cohnella abietis TaxID=2507935 RepID=A0A3T1D8G4_9BACL|nr:ABC transporter ATP-binding protein [Cohnella abietis]BBI34345.1 energy-coupling factor transporter ATP-binding protein EcfA [Cohnella abietis]